MKNNKGITLIALIITIIVLLILAGVGINAVREGNLFAHANSAASTYKDAAERENSLISSYIAMMEEYSNNAGGITPTPSGNIQYYLIEQTEDGATYEEVFAIDFSNNLIKLYFGKANEDLILEESINVTEFVYRPFTILLDNVETTITDGIGIKLNIEGNEVIPAYIQDGKLYMGEPHEEMYEFSSSGYVVVDTNFDASRLREEEQSDIQYYSLEITESGTTYEEVIEIDFSKNIAKLYFGPFNEDLTLEETMHILEFVFEPFTVLLDNVETTISDGIGIKLNIEGNEVIPAYIQDGKLYMGEPHEEMSEFASSEYAVLDTNLNTSRLKESQPEQPTPEQPTKVTFTIIPTPNDATVMINGQERTSITVEEGTNITWSVSGTNYVTQSGTHCMSASSVTQSVTLVKKQVTFTVAPTPSSATVEMIGELEGHTVTANKTGTTSLSVDAGTTITYEVSATNYTTVTDYYTIGELTYNLSVVLPTEIQGDFTYYNYDSTNKTATVTGLSSQGESKIANTVTTLTMPDTVIYNNEEYTITSISSYAFSNRTNLDLTSLPSGVTSIENLAFNNCTNLALTSLPSGVTSIGDYAFYNCSNLALTSLPTGVTSIGGYAFCGCSNLALTSLPSGLTNIERNTFSDCSSLALTSLPNGVTSIGSHAFINCTDLALTSLPNGVISIGDNAFYNCTNIALTSLPSGLTSIRGGTFFYCTNLALTSLPSGVTSIDNMAFGGCTSLALTSLPSGLTSLGDMAFLGCTNITSITLPSTLTTVGSSIFSSCNSNLNIYVETLASAPSGWSSNWYQSANENNIHWAQ